MDVSKVRENIHDMANHLAVIDSKVKKIIRNWQSHEDVDKDVKLDGIYQDIIKIQERSQQSVDLLKDLRRVITVMENG